MSISACRKNSKTIFQQCSKISISSSCKKPFSQKRGPIFGRISGILIGISFAVSLSPNMQRPASSLDPNTSKRYLRSSLPLIANPSCEHPRPQEWAWSISMVEQRNFWSSILMRWISISENHSSDRSSESKQWYRIMRDRWSGPETSIPGARNESEHSRRSHRNSDSNGSFPRMIDASSSSTTSSIEVSGPNSQKSDMISGLRTTSRSGQNSRCYSLSHPLSVRR